MESQSTINCEGLKRFFVSFGECAVEFVDHLDDSEYTATYSNWHTEECFRFISGFHVHVSIEALVLVCILYVESVSSRCNKPGNTNIHREPWDKEQWIMITNTVITIFIFMPIRFEYMRNNFFFLPPTAPPHVFKTTADSNYSNINNNKIAFLPSLSRFSRSLAPRTIVGSKAPTTYSFTFHKNYFIVIQSCWARI